VQRDDLRVFLTVAQAGSLRKSARALRLGQPTIGQHLHQLERTGDAHPSLLRLTPPIEEVEADYWLLVHPDLKTVPRARHVMERIRGVFKASRAALRG